jgi:dolichol-phosphate mannosyltransferase
MRNRFIAIIPAYNEAATIAEVARRCRRYADVCVVDDASSDGTGQLAASVEGVHCIRHPRNTHVAQAILDGMRYAVAEGYEFFITLDAGLSHDPGAIPRFQEHTDADLVLGYRQAWIGVPLYRRGLSYLAKTLVNLALERKRVPWGGAGIRDVSSGYRMYSRSAAELLIHSKIRSRSFDFQLEALAIVFRSGMRIHEIPISYLYSNSSFRPAAVWEAFRTCMGLWIEPTHGGRGARSHSGSASSAASSK